MSEEQSQPSNIENGNCDETTLCNENPVECDETTCCKDNKNSCNTDNTPTLTETKGDENFVQVVRKNRNRFKTILQDVASGRITPDSAETMLRQRRRRVVVEPYLQVTRNGLVALYGIYHRPIVLYSNQWEKLNTFMKTNAFSTFMEENKESVRQYTICQYNNQNNNNRYRRNYNQNQNGDVRNSGYR